MTERVTLEGMHLDKICCHCRFYARCVYEGLTKHEVETCSIYQPRVECFDELKENV